MAEEQLQNKSIPCVDCPNNKEFIFTAAEQKYFILHNLIEPKRCRPHRLDRRAKIAQMEREGKFNNGRK